MKTTAPIESEGPPPWSRREEISLTGELGTALVEGDPAEMLIDGSEVASRFSSWPQGATPVSPAPVRHTVVLSGVASDSHTWNLVYLQLLIEELGHEVVNLGPCVPDELLLERCLTHQPDLVVLSTVNGHGYQDGVRVVRLLRSHEELARTPMVIGGKLGTNGPGDGARGGALLAAGFNAVFEDGSEATGRFHSFLEALPQRVLSS